MFTMPEDTVLVFTTIRYLGWLGEGLIGLPGSTRQQDAVEAAGHCCDRIDHIAQYEVDAANREGYAMAWEQRARMLAGDVEYIRLALNRHAKTLVDWRGYLPTMAMLDDLTRAFAAGPSSNEAEAAALSCCDKQPITAPDAPIDVNLRIKQLEAALQEADRRAGCAERSAASLQKQLRRTVAVPTGTGLAMDWWFAGEAVPPVQSKEQRVMAIATKIVALPNSKIDALTTLLGIDQ